MNAPYRGPVLLLYGADTWRIGYSVQLGLAESIAGRQAVQHTLVQRLKRTLRGTVECRGRAPVVILWPLNGLRVPQWVRDLADWSYDLGHEQDWLDLKGDARSRCWWDPEWAA